MSIATVILAAGGSTRMGSSKQLLPFRGQPMVAHAASMALSLGLGSVVVVVGSEAEQVENALQELAVQLCRNPRWQAGMGSSIQYGVQLAASDSSVDGVIITLADQPLVDGPLLKALATIGADGVAAACRYGGSVGVPAYFGRPLFDRLMALPETLGAKHLLAQLGDSVRVIDAPQAATDVDTPDDYQRVSVANQS